MKVIRPNLMTYTPLSKRVLFLDMDGVLADFDEGVRQIRGGPFNRENDPPEMWEEGFYTDLPLMPGAKEAVAELETYKNLDIYIGSKPTTKPTAVKHLVGDEIVSTVDPMYYACPSEKYSWIYKHFPQYIKKIMLACDKALLNGDYLLDDCERWIGKFEGTYLFFDHSRPEESWKTTLEFFREELK